eukprot:TRINITY_DN25217_c0_g1_i1.p1 TRINITY_DN25217_c0_g1~~TRINITY_DN25217_c0_g1_i1.p1  ORF type:complete len:359 (-),score=54.97 TRINITY_DN25217_c0_g1_i1:392-1468(-)
MQVQKQNSKRPREGITFEQKKWILDYTEQHPTANKKQIADVFNKKFVDRRPIDRRRVGDIIKNKEIILGRGNNIDENAKRIRCEKSPRAQDALGQIIPVENAIAQLSDASGENNKIVPVYPVVNSVEEAALMLNVLEKGSNGVVLQTQNPHQVEEMCQFMSDQQSNYIKSTQLSLASISKVSEVDGLCDRVCVDVCSMMVPGEGMLVGCFSRGLFLVHSECEESGYINSRPFRVNAGAVSCYVQCPDGRTQYLSEIQCGSEVAIFDVNGKETKAIVGRSKIEQRPMVIIEAIVEGDEGDSISVVLQNAETVKLCGPADTGGWRTIPVTEMKLGDKVFVQCIGGARHTGIVVQESIIEK